MFFAHYLRGFRLRLGKLAGKLLRRITPKLIEKIPLSKPPFQHAVILGVGLIGGSIALALRERGLADRVTGIARSPERADNLLQLGLVDEATDDLGAGLKGADLVVSCLPVGKIADSLLMAAQHTAPGALLTDAGSTKGEIVAKVEAKVAGFVGSHPLAGDHRTGPEAARADLLDGALSIVTPTASTSPATIAAAKQLWESLGSRVEAMSPAEHDRVLALTSHVPHVVAAALAAHTPEEVLRLAATGWADTTRVAAGSPTLWRDILLANREAVTLGIKSLSEELAAYSEALAEADGNKIEQLFAEGKRRRDALGS